MRGGQGGARRNIYINHLCLMISLQASILRKPSSSISISMRAIALLCLLHAASGQNGWGDVSWNTQAFSWLGPNTAPSPPVTEQTQNNACLKDEAACGCCLMHRQMNRMEWFFNITHGEINKELTKVKRTLDDLRASRSAFSVSLNNENRLGCLSPLSGNQVIVYKHVFINLGGGYNLQTGIFTVPRSGVYSLSVTIYATASSNATVVSCANLQVNGQVVSELLEKHGQDVEDSATVVLAMTLKAGDQVSVHLPKGCVICDHNSHYNTFTGFLLYATD